MVLRIRRYSWVADRRSHGSGYISLPRLDCEADQIVGTLVYSFAPPPKVIDAKKTDEPAADTGAIPLETRRSDKVVVLDNGLRQRTAKVGQSE